MKSLNPSAAKPSPPEFFLDRSLGRSTAACLRQEGWLIHLVNDVFANDAQETPDEAWIAYGNERRWCLLTKDLRIRYRAAELAALGDGAGIMFVLSSGNLTLSQQVRRFCRSREAIETAARTAGPALHVVYEDSISRRWP